MHLHIEGTEAPSTLRALARFLSELAGDTALPANPFTAPARGPGDVTIGGLACVPLARPSTEYAAGVSADSDDTPPPSSGSVDCNGVPFDPAWCANAAEKFYTSGPRIGQWKKRRGVDEAAFNAWYDGARGPQAEPESAPPPAPVPTASAFAATPPAAPAATPKHVGEFMAWCAEKQAAQRLDQADIQAAYLQTGITVTDLFPPQDLPTVADRIAKLYAILVVKAGA